MILSNASTSAGLRNYTRFLTNTDTTSFTSADLDASLNMYYHLFVNEIIEAMDGWDFQGEIATTSTVASQQEYVFPSTILKIKRVEITYDGTTWNRAEFIDINARGEATDTTSISRDFTTSEPYVEIYDNSLFLYPIPSSAVTDGLKIWYEKEVTELSAATDEPSIMEAYHKGLCYGAAKDYFEKYMERPGYTSKRDRMVQNYNEIVSKMRNLYNKRTQDQEYIITPPYVDYGYGNE